MIENRRFKDDNDDDDSMDGSPPPLLLAALQRVDDDNNITDLSRDAISKDTTVDTNCETREEIKSRKSYQDELRSFRTFEEATAQPRASNERSKREGSGLRRTPRNRRRV
jgi:hypothetical protein